MALQMETGGWQPQFELSALRSGEKYALAKDQEEEELKKAFLANLDQYIKMPQEQENRSLENIGMGFDNQTKALAAAQANTINTPERLAQYGLSKDADTRQQIYKGEQADLLQPFVKEQIPIEQGTKTKQLGMANDLAQIDQLLSNGGYDQYGNQATPQQMQMWGGLRKQIVERMGQTPELSGKTALEHVKGDYDLRKAEIMASAQRDSAISGSKAAWAQAMGPATQLITQTQNALAKLDSNEMDEQLAGMIATRGLKRGTPEFEAALKSEKDTLRVELNKQLTEGNRFLQEVRSASGLSGNNPQPASTYSNQSSSTSGSPAQFDYVPGKGLVKKQQ